ncbi:MAG: anthranilate synthase component I family protein [Nitrososphaerales archaeon]
MGIFGRLSQNNVLSFRRLSIDKTPFELFSEIYTEYDHAFILESLTGPREMSEMSVIGFDPSLVVSCDASRFTVRDRDGHTDEYEITEPMQQLRALVPRVGEQGFRYVGGAVGYVSYDAIRYWENLPLPAKKRPGGYPYMEFGIYTDGILFNHKENQVYYFYLEKPRIDELRLGDLQEDSFEYAEPVRNIDQSSFTNMVEKAKNYIYDGDIYQVVLSKRFNFDLKGSLIRVYDRLREVNPSPYKYFLKMGGRRAVIGSSPEMLIRVSSGNVETFPIAGTRPIVGDKIKNVRLREEMLRDEKELAEHTMLVDLARNDIGRVCRWGTVRVDELMAVKEFSHVQHIVSHVNGELQKACDCYDAFRAVFPAGTVSGAPKVRAMEIIDELEPDARGPYAGALGYFSFNGSCDFAITIRSMFVDENKAYLQAGAGIVADSVPENEWMETEHKANALTEALKRASQR